ncbi:MAG: hypothetical protein Q8P44_05435, partial [Dehalococcoidia bacterium]|nr:hypothetical protein [Dehalococcoidia bacterium]
MFEKRYRDMDLPEVKSLEEIQNTLGQVSWSGDGFLHLYDSVSYPQTVWAKKRDDCDGFSILAASLLQNLD